MNVARAIQDALDEQSAKDNLAQIFWIIANMPLESRDYLADYDIRPGDKHGAQGTQTFK